MAYAALKDMVVLFGEAELSRLTAPEDERTAGPDAGKIERALADASDMVDTHLRERYAVPLAAPVSPMIVRGTADIARFMLASEGNATVSDRVKDAHDRTLRWLRGIAENKLSLDGLKTATGATTTDRSRVVTARVRHGGFGFGGGGYDWLW